MFVYRTVIIILYLHIYICCCLHCKCKLCCRLKFKCVHFPNLHQMYIMNFSVFMSELKKCKLYIGNS